MELTATNLDAWTKALFATVDTGTPEEIASWISPDGTLRLGNADPVIGRDDIREMSAGFRASLAGLEHEIVGAWRTGDTVITELSVTYRRHDGQTLTLPCVNIFDLDSGGLIQRYQVFMDINPVFA